MKTRLALLLAFFAILLATPALAYTNQSGYFECDSCLDCNQAIQNDTINVTRLNTSLQWNSTCIGIDDTNKTFDCQGNSITGNRSDDQYGIYITAGNFTIRNCIIDGYDDGLRAEVSGDFFNTTARNMSYAGINLIGSTNAELTNLTITGAYYGILLQNVSGTTINNVTITNSTGIGLEIMTSTQTTINASSVLNSTYSGIQAYDSNDTILRQTIMNENQYGLSTSTNSVNLSLYSCEASYNTLGGVQVVARNSTLIIDSLTALSNGNNALYVEDGDSYTFTNLTVINNTGGILLINTNNSVINNSIIANTTGTALNISNGYGNTIYSNRLTNSSVYGVHLKSTSSNEFYDNLFNNTQNILFTATAANTWNTTLHFGLNILGFNIVGGNYWATPSGSGFSETVCVDADANGICDNYYNFATDNTDYLPLSATRTPPTVQSQYPATGTFNDTYNPINITFNCSANDATNELTVLELWLTNSTNESFSLNQSTNVSGYDNNTNWTVPMPNGNYSWSCRATSTINESAFGTNNTLLINYTDFTAPNVSGRSPSESTFDSSSTHVLQNFTCEVTDDYELANVSLYLTNSTNESFAINQTSSLSGTNTSTSWAVVLSTGNYTWNCLVTDEGGNTDWGVNLTFDVNGTRLNVTNVDTGENFTSIQAAIDDNETLDTHTINIPAATFYENVIVNKSVTLNGTGRSTSKIVAYTAASHVILVDTHNVTITGLNLTGASNAAGVYVLHKRNISLSQLHMDDSSYGLYFYNATGTLSNLQATRNTLAGFELAQLTGLSASNLVATDTTFDGLSLQNVNSSTFTSITATDNNRGIDITLARTVAFSDVTIDDNYNGIGISSVNDSTFSNLAIIESAGYGISLSDAYSNTISYSNITDTGSYGIRVNQGGTNNFRSNNITDSTACGLYFINSSNNDIYDNYFYNTNNTYDDGGNDWDTSGVGTNILGGNRLGGNYYGTPNGSGCSQLNTTVDIDGDGIADYGDCTLPGADSLDERPLTLNYEEFYGQDTGGHNYYDPNETRQQYDSFMIAFSKLEAGERYSWTINTAASVIKRLSFEVEEDFERVTIRITQYAEGTTPTWIPEALAGAKQYIKIEPVGMGSSAAKGVFFKVDLLAVETLYIYDAGEWVPLQKTRDSGYYKVISPHLSWFAIRDGTPQFDPGPEPQICEESCLLDDFCNNACDSSTYCSSDPDCAVPNPPLLVDPEPPYVPPQEPEPFQDPDPNDEEPTVIESSFSWWWIVIFLFVVSLFGAGGYYFVMRQESLSVGGLGTGAGESTSAGMMGDASGGSPFPGDSGIPGDGIQQRHDPLELWVRDRLKEGYPTDEIIRALERKGWSREHAINTVKAAQPEQAYDPHKYHHQNKIQHKKTLEKHIILSRAAGQTDTHIRTQLMTAGWDPMLVEEVMDGARHVE